MITGFDSNCSSGASLAITANGWTTPNTYIGSERVPGNWTLVGTGAGISAANNTPSHIDTSDFVLPVGSTGIAIQINGFGVSYTNGNGGNQAFSDANLALSLGAALASQFLTTGLLFSPRVWNGTIYYATVGDATYGVLGAGFGGCNGAPKLAATSASYPSSGKTLSLDLTGGPSLPTPGTICLGFNKTSLGALPLPIDLGVIGMTNCKLYLDPAVNQGVALIGGVAKALYPIPNSKSLFGLAIYHQAFLIDSTANSLGLFATNAGEGWIGN